MAIDLGRFAGYWLLLAGGLRLPQQIGDERLTRVDQFLARPPAIRRSHGVLAEEREADRRIDVGDHRVGQDAGIDLPPAHGFGRGGARQSAPDDLIGRELDEVVVAPFGNPVTSHSVGCPCR